MTPAQNPVPVRVMTGPPCPAASADNSPAAHVVGGFSRVTPFSAMMRKSVADGIGSPTRIKADLFTGRGNTAATLEQPMCLLDCPAPAQGRVVVSPVQGQAVVME